MIQMIIKHFHKKCIPFFQPCQDPIEQWNYDKPAVGMSLDCYDGHSCKEAQRRLVGVLLGDSIQDDITNIMAETDQMVWTLTEPVVM